MANKSHLKFLNKEQLSEIKDFKYNYGFETKTDDEDSKPKDYRRLALFLRRSLRRYNADIEAKYDAKDDTLEIPHDIDYVLITFQGQFVISKYFDIYYTDFGLEAAAFYDFATHGLFAVVDREKFEDFITNVNNFISRELDDDQEAEYSNKVKYISSFKLLRTRDILKFQLQDTGGIVYLSLMDLPLFEKIKQDVLESLLAHFEINAIAFKYDSENDRIELHSATPDQIQKIIENFDIIESATCSAFTTVRPGEYNTSRREIRLHTLRVDEGLPIVGIIDTGISQESVLEPLIIDDSSFSLAGHPFIDLSGWKGLGHGTAVAGLVAFGKHNHRNNFEGDVIADARLLSIKISDKGNEYISELDLLKMLYDVKRKYPEIRLFTLTTCYSNCLNKNEAFSDYTYALDKFAYETNSLIFICTGNNNNCINENTDYDLSYFHGDQTNLCTPADSLNNITVGAAADNLKEGAFLGAASGREFPALFTRKGHIDLTEFYDVKKTNKNYFKPDVIESGGDIGFNVGTLDWIDESAITLISARPEIGITHETGTSFSAPLVANLAAKIIKNYPALSNESVKALIINGASTAMIPFTGDEKKLANRVTGNGLVDEFKSLYSNENSATLILEDVIENGKIRIYPLNFPEYLVKDDLGKKNRLLKVTATLCFKFLPIKNNQLSYNPIHMAFSIFKNHSAEDIMKTDDQIKSKLKTTLSWSENGRHVSKPLPYSNTQKITMLVNLANLENEANTFKLAIHAKLSEQIVGGIPPDYPTEFPFSIVLTIEETLKKNTGKLYDEIQLVNSLEVIQEADLDAGLEANVLEV